MITEPQEIDAEEFSSYRKENLPEIECRLDLETLRYLLEDEDDSSALFYDYGNMTGEAVRSFLVTETYYNGEDAVTSQSQIKYEYDEQGNKTKEIYYLTDGSIVYYVEWTYERL